MDMHFDSLSGMLGVFKRVLAYAQRFSVKTIRVTGDIPPLPAKGYGIFDITVPATEEGLLEFVKKQRASGN
jgi:hypothetical protein